MSRWITFIPLLGYALALGWGLFMVPPAEAMSPAQAQMARGAEQAGMVIAWNSEGDVPQSVRGADLSAKGAYSSGRGRSVRGQGHTAGDAVAVMDNLAGLFRITDAAREFQHRKTQGDSLGFNHVRLQQTFQGLPVVGGEVIVHFNKSGKAYQVNGRYRPNIAINPTPTLSAAQIVALAQADLNSLNKPSGELAGKVVRVVYARGRLPLLAYELTLTYKDDQTGAGRWRYWIDAHSGTVVERYNDIQNIPAPTSSGNPRTLIGSILAGEGGVATNVTGWYDNVNTNCYLYNTNLHWIVENVALSGYPDANTYAFRTTTNWGTSDRAEMSIAQAFDLTQKYYRQVHGLNSFDGLGIQARANAHQGTRYVNAYWDGSEFYFGDGDGATADSLAVLDIAGHEFTHAVTEYSAGLVYEYESGALNESFSDILGTCVEFFGEPDDRVSYPAKNAGLADWLCGEDSWLASTALRDLRNPANALTVGVGNEQPTRYQGSYWDPLQEVHQNSGVQNFFFYLLCEGGRGVNDGIDYSVTGIGITNAERVAYRALTVYCTPDTDYRAVRSAWLSAAMDLNPVWAGSVASAWDAVGVQAVAITPASRAAFSGSEGGPFSPVAFVFTITNADFAATGWGVRHTQTWVTVTPANGTLPAFGSQAVTVSVNSAASVLHGGSYADSLVFTNSASDTVESRGVTLQVLPPVVYAFDLNTDPGWSTEGQWGYGVPQGLRGDPSSGATGPNVYGYNLAGAYPDDMPIHALTLPPLDCSGYENLQLSFWRWLGVEHSAFDHATIQVSTNGTDWANVWDHVGESLQDTSWQNCIYSLPGASGQSAVYLRWLMGPTDGSVTYSGWNIDDIRIHGAVRDAMRVSPGDGLTSLGYVGGPFSPTSKTYSVINGGSNTFNWTASTPSTWFSVSLAGGSLTVGATATVSVALTPEADAFPPGQYSGAVTFSNSTSGFTALRAVTLTVRAIPGEIEVTDSIPPDSDLRLPFDDVIIGLSRTESISITNSDAVHPIVLSRISFGAYLEDFNDGLAQDWNPTVGAVWNVVSGEYRAQSAVEAWMLSQYEGKTWNDVTAQMTCRRAGDSSYSAALILRASADFDDGVGSAYIFQISLDGEYSIWKQVAGSWSWIQSWTTSLDIQPGVNVLRATAQGSALSFYINGTLVWSGNDSSLAGGRIGLGGYTGGDTIHFFDDVMAGDTLPTLAAVNEVQAAFNARSLPGGNPGGAPVDTLGVIPREPVSVDTRTIVSGAYRLANEPTNFPYSIPAHSSITFNVIYTPLATVSNAGEVVIENNDADEPDVHVVLSGHGILDYLQISPSTEFVPRGHPGGPFTPIRQVYVLTNSSALAILWTATHTQAWATVVPANGTLGIGAAQSVTVSVNEAASELGEGVYPDTVLFSNLTTGICQVRPATLTVFTSPQVSVTPLELWVTNKLGQSTTNILIVSNGALADGNLTFRLSSRSTGQTPLMMKSGAFVSQIQPGHDFTKVTPGAGFVPGELLVRFAEGMTGSVRATLLASLGGGEVRREYRLVPGLALVKLPPAMKVEDALVTFNRATGVVYAEPNHTVQAFDTTPNDARFSELWGLRNTGQTGGTPGADIDAPSAWDSHAGSTNIIVCVIDTGIDYNHEDLAGNMWHNPGEIPGNLIDDDGNGYVDDVYGINAITGTGDPLDDHDHGTHVSGTIGGIGNNSVGVAGVNWRVSLMAAKFLDAGGSGDTANAITCVDYAAGKGAKVLSNSWGGGGYSQALKDAIDAAGAAEIAFVAAAGNANSDNDVIPSYPSGYTSSNIIAVMATDHNDLKSSFSSYGQTTVDLAAPGTDILSCRRNGGYQLMSGTSMATPHVAGAAALLLSVNPLATVGEIRQVLMSTVDVLFPTRCVSGGRLNLARALNQMSLPWLSLIPTAATNLPPGSATNIQVGFHAGELAPANYNGEIVVSCNDVTNPTVVVPVHMTILRDDLVISPATGFTASGIVGGPFAPMMIVYTVSNAGPSSITWSLAHAGDWLSVSSTGGTLAPSDINAVTATVNAGAASLAVGDYGDTLTFFNALSDVTQKRMAQLSVQPVPPVAIHTFPLDTNPGWTTEGQWEFGVPQGLWGDPSSGFTGVNVYGYHLAGSYSNYMPVYALTTPALDCQGFTNVSLSFRRWLGVESADYDHATIQVSHDGVNWVTVWDHTGGSFQETSWQAMSYDLSAVADDQPAVYLRWLMGPTDESVVFSGWNIDDIQVVGRPGDPMRVCPATNLVAAGYAGGPFAPPSAVYSVSNSLPVARSLGWSAVANQPWVTLAPTSGVLVGGAAAGVTVSINNGANALTVGLHQATVTFANTNTGFAVIRRVNLDVNEIPLPPETPHDPSPTNGTHRVPTDVVLAWNNSSTTTYDVFLGTNSGALVHVATNVTPASFDPTDLLDFDATYYWRVVASNVAGVATGSIWSFNTAHDMVHFLSASFSVGEVDGLATIRVVRHNPAAADVTVEYGSSNGTACAGWDFTGTNGTMSFTAGQLTNTFLVPLIDDTDAEPSETVNLYLRNFSANVVPAPPTNAVLTIVDNEGIVVSLPYSLYDGSNFLWDVQGNGSILDGTSDAYDGGHVLLGFPNFTSSALVASRQIMIGPFTSGTVRVMRKIYVPADHGFCRFLEVLENIGGTVVTNRVRIDSNLGSDSGTIVDCTSSGNTTFETNDDWIVTDDADGVGDPTLAHVIANAWGLQRALAVDYSPGLLGYEYTLVLAPGETKIVMHFGAQHLNRAIARTNAATLVKLQNGALDLMSPAEIGQVVNFGLALPGRDSDSDGIPDDWENAHGLNASASNSPTANADGDWMTDFEEYTADTDPTNSLSFFPSIILTAAPPGTLSLVVDPTSTARVYGVRWTTNLMQVPPVWTLILPEYTGTTSGLIFTITNETPARYYRTRVRLP